MSLVLVAGAAGFLGRYICRTFSQLGHDVIAIGRGAMSADERTYWGVRWWLPGTISSPLLDTIPEPPHIIINCTGSGDSQRAFYDPAPDIVENVITTTALLEFARVRAAHSRFVHVSSGAVFGTSAILPVPDSAQRAPQSAYGHHKALAELVVEEFAGTFGVQSSIVRVFSVVGPHQRRQLMWDAALKARANTYRFRGTGMETRDWVAAQDVAALMPIAAKMADCPALKMNCATGVETTLRETLEMLAFALGEHVRPEFDGVVSPHAPTRYFGANDIARTGGWIPRQTWQEAVVSFATWFNSLNTPAPTSGSS